MKNENIKLIKDIDEKFNKIIELGLKNGKIKRSRYIPVKFYKSDNSTDCNSKPQEEIKHLYVIENGAIDKMLKNQFN